MQQHSKTVEQLKPDELAGYLDWFRTLPMWLDLEGLRVVHACWDDAAIHQVRQGLEKHGGTSDTFLRSACKKDGALFAPVEVLLKGKEAKLPQGITFQDKDGHHRTEVRTRWYLPPQGHSYQTYALQTDPIDCDLELAEAVIAAASPYGATAKPVFVGHYWLSAQRPRPLAHNVACLDYSVAKGGFLCAYRWHGEQKLNDDHFVWTSAAGGRHPMNG